MEVICVSLPYWLTSEIKWRNTSKELYIVPSTHWTVSTLTTTTTTTTITTITTTTTTTTRTLIIKEKLKGQFKVICPLEEA